MDRPIATIKRTKEIQEKYNVFTKKSYGQNFIIEPRVVEKIADAAIKSKDELVFEIGPGIGALTQYLTMKSDQVIAFEIDDRLPEVLENEIGYDHLKIVLKDILASQNDKEYNALSVITQYRCDIKKVMDVSRHVFWPSPNVDSAVLQFTFHHKYNLKDEELFFKMVKACFVQRRKTIYNNFQTLLKDKEEALQLLEKAQLKSSIRAQQCTLEDFIRLYEVSYESLCTGKS